MREAIEKASTLIEALEWIRKFRDKITVIKLGGSVMGDEAALRHVLIDIVFMETVGMRPVLVHGAGDLISQAMRKAGLEPRFVQGRRYTDEATLQIVEEVLAYQTNERLTAAIEDLGGRAMNLNFRTTNVLIGESISLESEGGPVDLGYVGKVTEVNRSVIENLCYAGTVPVIPSMCVDDKGQILNVNADTVATAVAQSLGAEKLVFLSDINGVRLEKDNPDSLVHTLTADSARELIDTGVIEAGMIPKVEACLETLDQGVGKVHIIDGRIRHSLLLEVYTSKGIGTQLVRESQSQSQFKEA